jgi:hypothetical protein
LLQYFPLCIQNKFIFLVAFKVIFEIFGITFFRVKVTKQLTIFVILPVSIQINECSSHAITHTSKYLIQTQQINQRTSILIYIDFTSCMHCSIFLETKSSSYIFDEIDVRIALLLKMKCKIRVFLWILHDCLVKQNQLMDLRILLFSTFNLLLTNSIDKFLIL